MWVHVRHMYDVPRVGDVAIMDCSQNYALHFILLHFICITFHLHLKIMPRQHEMHDTSQFKCHALYLHFMK